MAFWQTFCAEVTGSFWLKVQATLDKAVVPGTVVGLLGWVDQVFRFDSKGLGGGDRSFQNLITIANGAQMRNLIPMRVFGREG